MILRGEKKFIKIRLKPELRHQASRIERQTNWLVVRVTYYCEYNRKLLVRLAEFRRRIALEDGVKYQESLRNTISQSA